jgi:hypothetical protein
VTTVRKVRLYQTWQQPEAFGEHEAVVRDSPQVLHDQVKALALKPVKRPGHGHRSALYPSLICV